MPVRQPQQAEPRTAAAPAPVAPAPLLADATTERSAQAAQAGLVALVMRDALSTFTGVDTLDDASIRRLAALYDALAGRYAPASAVLAMRQYSTQRLDEGIRDGFTPRPTTLPSLGALRVEWAISNAIGPEGVDVVEVQRALANSLGRTVQDSGRQTIITNVRRDRQATAWARIPEPELTVSGTCSFCAMLCSRGAVYKQETVQFRSHLPRNGQGHVCVCHAAPVFGKYRPDELAKRYQDLWQSAVVDQNRHGRDARTAFRQAVEGRDVTGLDDARSSAQMRPEKARVRSGNGVSPRDVSPEEAGIRRQISELKASNLRIASGEITGDEAAKLRFANNKRIDALNALLR